MELFCEKYKETMAGEVALCAHPDDYCKFRTACLIHFMGQERRLEERKTRDVGQGGTTNSDKSTKEA